MTDISNTNIAKTTGRAMVWYFQVPCTDRSLLTRKFLLVFRRLRVLGHEARLLAPFIAHKTIEAQSTNTADDDAACWTTHNLSHERAEDTFS
jgi:hypothetical protein